MRCEKPLVFAILLLRDVSPPKLVATTTASGAGRLKIEHPPHRRRIRHADAAGRDQKPRRFSSLVDLTSSLSIHSKRLEIIAVRSIDPLPSLASALPFPPCLFPPLTLVEISGHGTVHRVSSKGQHIAQKTAPGRRDSDSGNGNGIGIDMTSGPTLAFGTGQVERGARWTWGTMHGRAWTVCMIGECFTGSAKSWTQERAAPTPLPPIHP